MGKAELRAPASATALVVARGSPLILASKSASRRALLAAVGLEAEVVAVEVDERALEDRHFARGGSLDGLACELAQRQGVGRQRGAAGRLLLGRRPDPDPRGQDLA